MYYFVQTVKTEAIYITNASSTQQIIAHSDGSNELIIIHLKQIKCTVAVMYRPPNSDAVNTFNLLLEKNNVLLLGDSKK